MTSPVEEEPRDDSISPGRPAAARIAPLYGWRLGRKRIECRARGAGHARIRFAIASWPEPVDPARLLARWIACPPRLRARHARCCAIAAPIAVS